MQTEIKRRTGTNRGATIVNDKFFLVLSVSHDDDDDHHNELPVVIEKRFAFRIRRPGRLIIDSG
jgi:hypothetical protein